MESLRAAGVALGGRSLRAVGEALGGSDRSTVVRAAVDGGGTVVVKTYAEGEAEGWQREAAALSVLRGRGLSVPDLLAVSSDPRLIVTADLGAGPSLADALLGADPNEATARLEQWARSLGRLHRSTIHSGAAFAEYLGEYGGDAAVDTTGEYLGHAAEVLAGVLPRLGVVPATAALAELRTLGDRLNGESVVLTPADMCPDNNILTANGLVLIDFETATVRHVAWDVAYLEIPWPSCWCSWRLPKGPAGAALARWRAEVAAVVPFVDSEEFGTDLALASVGWAFITLGWFLRRALRGDETVTQWGRPSPPLRAIIQHRLAGAMVGADTAKLPALGALAAMAHAAAVSEWGEAPLPLAPAYR